MVSVRFVCNVLLVNYLTAHCIKILIRNLRNKKQNDRVEDFKADIVTNPVNLLSNFWLITIENYDLNNQ